MNKYIIDETKSHLSLSRTSASGTHTPRESNIVGSCPVCGKNLVMTSKYVLCEGYKNQEKGNCSFITGIDICGTKVPKTEFIKIFEGKKSKKMKFTSPRTNKTFEACLEFDKSENKIKFIFENP